MEEKFLQEEEHGAEKSSRFLTKESLSSILVSKSFADFQLAKIKGNRFSTEEKLKSKKSIDKLFKEGKSVSQSGFTLVYFIGPIQSFYPAQAAFTVPKRFFKHAVDRNRIKRLMRESYRLNKKEFYEKLVTANTQLACMFIYKGSTLPKQQTVIKSVVGCLNKIKLP